MSSLRQRIINRYKGIFTPRPKEPIAEWARKEIKLSPKESGDFPGDYDPDLNPLPTILFDVFQSGEYHRAVFKKSSQSGVTLAVLILICYFIKFIVRSFLYVIDSKDEMKRISKERLQPMLRSCKAVQGQITENEDDFTNLTLSLKGCTGYLGGSNSIGVLANKSVGLAVNDETDTYKDKRAIALTEERGKRQSSFFHILLSKPENWTDAINQNYLRGTRHRAFYYCPHCGTQQTCSGFDDWERIKYSHCKDMLGGWDYDRMNREIYLECLNEGCKDVPVGQFARQLTPDDPRLPLDLDESETSGRRITEKWKPWMIKHREWRATNEGKDEYKPVPGVFSCEIDDLMSTFPKACWRILATEWIEANEARDEEAMKKFKRGRCATAWKEKTIEVGDNDIYSMAGPYKKGHCPVEPWLVLMAVDRQQVVKKAVKTAFMKNGDCYIVDWGEFLSDADIVRFADEPVIVDKWNDSTPADRRNNPVVYKGLCDEGYEQEQVRSFVVSTFLNWIPDGRGGLCPNYRFYSCWGQGGIHSKHLRDLVVPTLDDKPNAFHNGFPIFAYRFSDDNFKAMLYNQRIKRFAEIKAAERNNLPPPSLERLWFPADIMTDRDFVAELCQEKFIYDHDKKKWLWKDPDHANDYGDALKMNLVAWYILAPVARLQEAQAEVETAAARAAKPS